ncbi:hypothetical protein QA648_27615 (plasmid) [Rhizobium sp. CB3171]|uniref:hypothetical protein n=1 Tax=Rhizobium sp. CB3171 TaxID=3039157 RepID=UPI0024B23430|nr:hypothetical protein [Rhizobium sp. CB3171]WFU04550.1 hypothetical protein QA648_27615 [Rhizobium sp. CB3171]
MTVVNQNTDGTVLKDANGLHERFSHEQIYLMTAERRIKVDRDYHSLENSVFALKYGNLKISDFADHKVQKGLWLESLIQEYIRFEEIGKKHPVLQAKGFKQRKVSLGVKCLKFLLPILKSVVVERWSEANGGKEVSYKLPSPRHFRRLHDVYIESNCDPLALVSLKTGPKSRTLCHPDDLKLWLEYSCLYADRKRPSMRECYLSLVARIDEVNEERSGTGQRLHHKPSRKCFEKLIKEMGAYYLMAKRHGEEYARRKYAIVHGGLMIERPGQIVEMDEWKVNLAVLLTHLRVWQLLSEKEREAVSRARVWLTVAIDRATKCILAMHFSRHALLSVFARGPGNGCLRQDTNFVGRRRWRSLGIRAHTGNDFYGCWCRVHQQRLPRGRRSAPLHAGVSAKRKASSARNDRILLPDL